MCFLWAACDILLIIYGFPDYLGVIVSEIARAWGGGLLRGAFNRDIDEGN